MEYKGYVIELGKNTSQHVIRHTGKGSLPKMLSGNFTSLGVAKKAVDKYVETKEQK
jgi:hypothetical protein